MHTSQAGSITLIVLICQRRPCGVCAALWDLAPSVLRRLPGFIGPFPPPLVIRLFTFCNGYPIISLRGCQGQKYAFRAKLVNTPKVVQELRQIAWFRRLSIYYNTYQKYIMRVLLGAIRLLLKDLFFFPDFHKKLFSTPFTK